MIMIQRGYNPKYPENIDTWKIGDKVPEWLSDRASVKFIDGEGNITLNINQINTGGFEIKNSGNQGILIKTDTPDSLICFSQGYGIFKLRPKQLNLLYKPQEEKK